MEARPYYGAADFTEVDASRIDAAIQCIEASGWEYVREEDGPSQKLLVIFSRELAADAGVAPTEAWQEACLVCGHLGVRPADYPFVPGADTP